MIEGLDEGSNRKDVSVVVRVRAGAENAIVRCSRPLPQSQTVFHEVSVGDGDKNRFTFDAVFGPHCSQADLYAAIGADVVKHSLEGYNACVMTYGQTSSGKTFSMLGPDGGSDRLFGDRTVDVRASQELGLVPRVLDTLFRRRNDKSGGEVSTNIEISCVELYNEVFFDLLSGDAEKSQNLRIREDANRGIFIEGAASLPVDNTPQLFDLLAKISSSKHTSFTAMNATSSRSHTIITVSVDQVDHVRHDSTTNSRIFLVDLAGSERIEKTGAMGDRLKEAQNINLSLTLLGNVIKKLTDGKSMHIPYRDSKLTRLLQNSLGGNSLTTLLCTISPDASNSSETLSTLGFAQRAKSIKNRPLVNKVLAQEEFSKEISNLRAEVAALQEKLRDLDGVARLRPTSNASLGDTSDDIRGSLESALRELHEVKFDLKESQRNEARLHDVVQFHQQREREIGAQLRDMQERLESERACSQAAVKKLDELMMTTTSQKQRDPPAGGTRFIAPAGLQKRTSTMLGDDKRARQSPNVVEQAKVTEVATPVANSTAVEVMRPAVVAEAQAVIRERMLLTQVDALQEELAKSRKFSAMCDHLMRELDVLKSATDQRIQENDATTKKLLEGSDKRVLDLEEKLEAEMRRSSTSAGVGAELKHLQMENTELHAENRANAGRLLDFTKRIDTLTKEVNELKDDRAKLATALEDSNMDSKLKQQLLSLAQARGSKDKSYFRKKLLECFSTD